MLNRTNRKLSANPFGLNLGTRSFAVKASANLSNLTRHFAARLESVRVGSQAERDQVWLDSIMKRSYPAIPMRPFLPADSSLHPQLSSHRGSGEGPTGQIVILASSPVGLLPPRADLPAAYPTPATPRQTLGQPQAGCLATTSHEPLPRNQVPDAAP